MRAGPGDTLHRVADCGYLHMTDPLEDRATRIRRGKALASSVAHRLLSALDEQVVSGDLVQLTATIMNTIEVLKCLALAFAADSKLAEVTKAPVPNAPGSNEES